MVVPATQPGVRVHIVRPTDGWILERYAESYRLPDATIGTAPDPAADVNYFVNYYLYHLTPSPPGPLAVGLFTHRHGDDDPGLRAAFDAVAARVDGCVAMCERTARWLPRERTIVLHGAADPIFRHRPLVLGVSTKRDAHPRKRIGWIEALEAIPGVEVRLTGGTLPLEALPAFYRDLDYLVVLSDNEGGPMPVLEALAMGKPVIAPNVGFAWDYPVVRYDGSLEHLTAVVRQLVPPEDDWARQSAMLLAFFERLAAARRA